MLIMKEIALKRFSMDWIVSTTLWTTVVFVRDFLEGDRCCNEVFCKWNKSKCTR
jgi:hypothetical protein